MKKLFPRLFACAALAATLSLSAQGADKKIIASESEKKNLSKLPFSPAILMSDGTLYLSGQAGFGKNGLPPNFADEVKTALDILGKTLRSAGYDFSDVVQSNVYLTDIDQIQEMNKIYLRKIADCDKAIEERLQCYAAFTNDGEITVEVKNQQPEKKIKKKKRNSRMY